MALYKIKIDNYNYVHDTWENDWYTCPNCGYDSLDVGFNYCPDCGENLVFVSEDEEVQLK